LPAGLPPKTLSFRRPADCLLPPNWSASYREFINPGSKLRAVDTGPVWTTK